jgi:hypothetical protein
MIAAMCTSKKSAPVSRGRFTYGAGVHPTCRHCGFILSRRFAALKLSETALRHFISTVTFSVQLHKLHSKVRTSGSSGPDTTPVSIIGPWHFGHGGRSISVERRSAKGRGMCSPPRSGESATLSVTDKCRVWDGDMGQCRKLYPVP